MAETRGARIKARRSQLGLSVRELAARSGVNRETVTRVEAGEDRVRESSFGPLERTLDDLEQQTGMDTADIVTSTIELPDGTKITFSGAADGVVEAVQKYLHPHG